MTKKPQNAEHLLTALTENPEDDRWRLFPFVVGFLPPHRHQALLDFRMRPIAARTDGLKQVYVLQPDGPNVLDQMFVIDEMRLGVFGNATALPRACRIVDEWGLVDELYQRACRPRYGSI